MTVVAILIAILAFFFILVLMSSVRIAREYERGVIFRLGRLIATKGPGLFLLIPLVDRMVKVDQRIVTMSVPPQEVITRDNVPAKVNAVVYFRVMEPQKAIVAVEDFIVATSQIAQTTLRSTLGQSDLDHLLAERDKINQRLQQIIDEQTAPWGIKVVTVEIKDVEIRRRCSGPWRGRPRRNASGGPRSSPPRASSRPRRSWLWRPTSSPPSRWHFSCVICRLLLKWPRSTTPPPSSRCRST